MRGKGGRVRSSCLKLKDGFVSEVSGSSNVRECVERNSLKSCNGCLDAKMEKRVSG